MTRRLTICVCAPDHAGTLNQALGVAEALARLLPAEGSSVPRIRLHRTADDLLPFAFPLVGRLAPDIAISCGRSGERKGRRLKRRRPGLLWAHVERVKLAGLPPDLNAVPAHDWTASLDDRQGVMRIAGVPHRIVRSDIEARRGRALQALAPGNRGVDLFLIGGPNEAFLYDEAAVAAILAHLRTAQANARLALVSTSRRTPDGIRSRLRRLAGDGIRFLDDVPALSYPDALAVADRIFVSQDSISMACEAAATGSPVFRMDLTERTGERVEKFRRFEAAWADLLRPADRADEPWQPAPPPPDDAGTVAGQMVAMIRKRD